ncbi:UNVERIFIED_CONTAM: hypothetical protein GTU68_009589 [Idotea baltica]|nr:hypothetical protein [Idotea baltica]
MDLLNLQMVLLTYLFIYLTSKESTFL